MYAAYTVQYSLAEKKFLDTLPLMCRDVDHFFDEVKVFLCPVFYARLMSVNDAAAYGFRDTQDQQKLLS
jgi:hypothetical protein